MENQERNNEMRSSPAERGESRDARGERPRGRFNARRMPRVCPFCKAKVEMIDFKDAEMLRRYLSERGKIKPRRKIGTCSRHQRRLALAVKRARHLALLSFTEGRTRE